MLEPMIAASFPNLDAALAALRLGPFRFRCRVCGGVHVSGSRKAEACATVIRESMRLEQPVHDPAVSWLEHGLQQAQRLYAPWLGLPWSGLPLCHSWSRPELDLFAASLAVEVPAGEVDRELQARVEAARERWLAWARMEAARRAKEYEETVAEASEILARPGELFEFELGRGLGRRVEYLRPLLANWMPVPRHVWFQEASGEVWAYNVAVAAGLPVPTRRRAAWPLLWDFRYSGNRLFLEVSLPGGSREVFSVRFERCGMRVTVARGPAGSAWVGAAETRVVHRDRGEGGRGVCAAFRYRRANQFWHPLRR